MDFIVPLRHCRRPLYSYINWCGSLLNSLFSNNQQPTSIWTIKTVNRMYCKFKWFLIPDSWSQNLVPRNSFVANVYMYILDIGYSKGVFQSLQLIITKCRLYFWKPIFKRRLVTKLLSWRIYFFVILYFAYTHISTYMEMASLDIWIPFVLLTSLSCLIWYSSLTRYPHTAFNIDVGLAFRNNIASRHLL